MKITVIGAGFGALTTIRTLRKRNRHVEITLIAPQPVFQYFPSLIWVPAGLEQTAAWILSNTGQEISGCCIQAAPRDFARFGQFILNGAVVNGKSIVPEGWLADATTSRTTIGQPGRGYGYQWWTPPLSQPALPSE